ncbi:MAG: glycine-rich domain-containing protein [Verrucomicrobiota bacterium]
MFILNPFRHASDSGAITTKSVVFDVADTWGSSTTSIRSIEFHKNGAAIPLTSSDFTAYATSSLNPTTYAPWRSFDTTLSKSGGWNNNAWFAVIGSGQRLIVVFNTPQEFDQIVVTNGHNSGNQTDRGARNVKITISDDAISDVTYNAVIANSTELNDTEWPEHAAGDGADDNVVWDNTAGPATSVTAKTVLFDITGGYGTEVALGIRSIEFKLNGSLISFPGTGYTAYGLESSSAFTPSNVFNTSLSKDGAASNNSWLSSSATPQRIIIVFDTPQEFDQIVINNYHDAGASTDQGVRSVEVLYSDIEVTNTGLGSESGSTTFLSDRDWSQHVPIDAELEQTVWAIDGGLLEESLNFVRQIGSDWVHVFREDGSFNGQAGVNVDYLIVAGGGGGGAGGGGAGGLLSDTFATAMQSYPVVVGPAGFNGGGGVSGGNGGDSSVFGFTAIGGGGGGASHTGTSGDAEGQNGGSGGGGGHKDGTIGTIPGTGTVGQGNDGGEGRNSSGSTGRRGGGGGGAGETGFDHDDLSFPSRGGDGLQNNITGVNQYYAGGGSSDNADTALGGGSYAWGGGGYEGQLGGPGIVILRYPV